MASGKETRGVSGDASTKRKDNSSGAIREGDWICSDCNSHNFSARVSCYRCSLAKEKSEFAKKGKKALDWTCFGCKTSNYSWRGNCYRCNITRGHSETLLRESGTAEWSCRFCEVRNFPEKRVCFKCHRDRRDAEMGAGLRGRLAPRRPPPGGCDEARHGHRVPPDDREGRPFFSRFSPPESNFGRLAPGGSAGPVYGSRGPGAPRAPPSPPPHHRAVDGGGGDWRCGLCGTENGFRRIDCYKCTTLKGGEDSASNRGSCSFVSSISGGGGSGSQIPDWICPQCEISNSGWSDTCFRCKEPIQGPGRGTSFGKLPGGEAQHLVKRGLLSTPGGLLPLRDPGSPKRRRMDTADPVTRLGYGPDWVCRFCQLEIFPKRSDCYKCGRSRYECEDVRRAGGGGVGGPGVKAGASSYCPLPSDSWGSRDMARHGNNNTSSMDTWFCDTCGIGNPRTSDGCRRCKTPRGVRRPSPKPRAWSPAHQSAYHPRDDGDRGGMFGGRSGGVNYHPSPRQPRHVAMATERRYGEPQKTGADWTCKFCRINNFAKRMKCFKCTKSRQDCQVRYDKRGREVGLNDWICGNDTCMENNYEWRDKCFMCRVPRST